MHALTRIRLHPTPDQWIVTHAKTFFVLTGWGLGIAGSYFTHPLLPTRSGEVPSARFRDHAIGMAIL